MLVIKIEIWPFGLEEKKRNIGTLKIVNNGTGNTFEGNYNAFFNDNKDNITKIQKFPRTEKNAWNLLYEVLKKRLKKGKII